jgi:hypothetical protein
MSTLKPLAASLALLVACVVHAETTTRYTISVQKKRAGEMVVTSLDERRSVVDFAYLSNGRGPQLHEDMTVDDAGRFVRYEIKGKSTYGSPVDEFFTYADGRMRWKSHSDNGEREGALGALYVPVESSLETTAEIARALLRDPAQSANALPAGKLSIRKLTETTLQSPSAKADVALYAVFGLDAAPQLIWLRNDDSRRIFAVVDPVWDAIETGWESRAGELLALQWQAERGLLQALAGKLAHRFADPVLIRSVRVFDSDTAKMQGPYDVYLFRGRIAAIEPAGSPVRDAATVIDGEGRCLLPGLFDMHGHESRWNAMLQIAGGVTTVRDMGNDNAKLEELRSDIEEGAVVGPRIVPTGFIEGNSQHAMRLGFVIDSVDEGKAAIDWYLQRGRRQIKLYNSIRPEWVVPLAEYAHSRGMRVGGHIPAFMRAEEAVRDGFDEIQHINQVMLNFLVKPGDDTRTLLRFYLVGDNAGDVDLTSEKAKAFFALLASRGTVVDPTIAGFEPSYTQLQGQENPAFRKIASHMPPTMQRNWLTNSMDVNPENVARFRASWAKLLELTRRMYDAGIPLVAGTDDIAGFTLHRELEVYVEAGIEPAKALQIATRNGAKYTQISDIVGNVTVGKVADVILVDGDPTKDISAVRNVSLVMSGRTTYYPAEVYEALGIQSFRPPPKVTEKREAAK